MRGTGWRHPLLISTGVRASASRSPGKIAVSTAERSLTYTQLVRRINQVCNLGVSGLGLERGGHVAVMLPNGIELIELVCGLSDIGVAAAVISPQATTTEVG